MDENKSEILKRIREMIESGKLKFSNNDYLIKFTPESQNIAPSMNISGKFVGADPAYRSVTIVEYKNGLAYFPETPESEKFYEQAKRELFQSLNEKQRLDYLFGQRPEEITSTVSNTPAPQMTLNSLKEAMQMLRDADPLLKKGVQKDWCCVIHPSLVGAVMDAGKDQLAIKHKWYPYTHDDLDYLMDRRTFIIEGAPTDRIEYMEELTMRKKYAEHFLLELKMRAKRQKEEEENDGNGT